MYADYERQPPLITRIIWHPFLITATFILHFWLISEAHPLDGIRALTTSLLGTFALLLVGRLALRSWQTSGLITSMVLSALIGHSILYSVRAASPTDNTWRIAALILLALLAAAFVTRGVRAYWRRPQAFIRVTHGLNIISSLLLIIIVGGALLGGGLHTPIRDVNQMISRFLARPPSTGSLVPAGPDIYLFLLDGYAGHETLAAQYDFDNSEFLAELSARNFDVADNSHSNYDGTQLTLASMLNMMPVQSLTQWQEISNGTVSYESGMRDAINRNELFEELYERGYRTTATSTPTVATTLHGAYDYLDSGYLNEFELEVLRSTGLLSPLQVVFPDLIGDQYRKHVQNSLQATHDLAINSAHRPRLIISHVMAPHLPAGFNADGSARAIDAPPPHRALFAWRGSGQDRDIPNMKEAYLGQIQYLNGILPQLIDDIISRSPEPPVIIVMSDHGPLIHRDDQAESFDNFFAAYTPNRNGLFPDNVTPVNIFPILLNAYMEADYPLWPNDSFAHDYQTQKLSPVQP